MVEGFLCLGLYQMCKRIFRMFLRAWRFFMFNEKVDFSFRLKIIKEFLLKDLNEQNTNKAAFCCN